LNVGGHTLPAGLNVIIPAIKLHRDKRYWGEDADEFKPERFKPENIAKVHTYAYLPFSRGPRNCIGYNYANYSMKVLLSHFFRRFKTSTTMKQSELRFEYMIVMKIIQGYNITLERRNFVSKK
jgi:cytochrome P450